MGLDTYAAPSPERDLSEDDKSAFATAHVRLCGGFHSGGRATGGTHFAGHWSGGGSHRSHRSGGFFFGFGAPYPYYYGDDSTVVCRYRRVRSHRHWVRRRYCWRQYW